MLSPCTKARLVLSLKAVPLLWSEALPLVQRIERRACAQSHPQLHGGKARYKVEYAML